MSKVFVYHVVAANVLALLICFSFYIFAINSVELKFNGNMFLFFGSVLLFVSLLVTVYDLIIFALKGLFGKE